MKLKKRYLTNFFLFSLHFLFFLYFFIFNKYHLWRYEQIQFFRFNFNYFKNFLKIPGGFIEYLGAFLIQFFYFPLFGALIITLLIFLVFLVFQFILRKIKLNGILFSLVPVLLIVFLQSNYQFSPTNIIYYLCILCFSAIYFLFKVPLRKLIFFSLSFLILYLITGFYSIIYLVTCCVYELAFYEKPIMKWIILKYCITSSLILYFSQRFLFQLPFKSFAIFPKFLQSKLSIAILFFLLSYLPFLIIFVSFLNKSNRIIQFKWSMKNIFAGAVIFFIFFIIIKNFSYNKKQELIFKIDYYSQSEQWVDVLKTAKKYPGNNQLVIYYTNLALAQQKQLSERLFSFSQIGEKGFRLKWERNQIASFYGGDVFFYLQNHNEAFRWAFESIVSIGVNPKGLKRLVETSIATNHLELAEKYLGIIEESLFYRAWANQKKRN